MHNLLLYLYNYSCNRFLGFQCFNIAGPEWASINLGVFLCIKCAGIHRRLSVSVSKVRSIRLDSWTKEMVQVRIN